MNRQGAHDWFNTTISRCLQTEGSIDSFGGLEDILKKLDDVGLVLDASIKQTLRNIANSSKIESAKDIMPKDFVSELSRTDTVNSINRYILRNDKKSLAGMKDTVKEFVKEGYYDSRVSTETTPIATEGNLISEIILLETLREIERTKNKDSVTISAESLAIMDKSVTAVERKQAMTQITLAKQEMDRGELDTQTSMKKEGEAK